jgi:neutral ceramidase
MSEARFGFGRVDITPKGAGFPAGYSVLARRVGPLGDGEPALTATALLLDDGAGRKLAIVHADLHCAGLALWRATLRRLPDFGPSELILAGTHTHLGPGFLYGSALFDAMTGPMPLPAPVNVGRIARRLAEAVRRAQAALAPGGACVVRVGVPGAASNRSLEAFRRNPAALRQAFVDGPGRAASDRLEEADRCVDPRLTLLIAGPVGEPPAGALGWFACHGTALGPRWPRWSAEWAGYAREAVERATRGPLGLASGCTGDTSPLPLDAEGAPRRGDDRPAEQGEALARAIGDRVANATIAALAQGRVAPLTLGVAHAMWEPGREVGGARYGLATIGGAIDGAKPGTWERYHAGVDAPGYRPALAYPPEHPQHPKVDVTRDLAGGALGGGPVVGWLAPRRLPLHAARIGGAVIVTVPGEPSTLAGFTIERQVAAGTGADEVVIAGYAGTYAGYWTTPEEYDQQRYEGASTLFGRRALPRLAARLADLAAIAGPSPAQELS